MIRNVSKKIVAFNFAHFWHSSCFSTSYSVLPINVTFNILTRKTMIKAGIRDVFVAAVPIVWHSLSNANWSPWDCAFLMKRTTTWGKAEANWQAHDTTLTRMRHYDTFHRDGNSMRRSLLVLSKHYGCLFSELFIITLFPWWCIWQHGGEVFYAWHSLKIYTQKKVILILAICLCRLWIRQDSSGL